MASDNGRATFATYQWGYVAGDMVPPALRRAIGAHRERYGRDPVGVVVNKAHLGTVRDALAGMGLSKRLVTTSGGCLAWEVWLEVATDGRGPKDAPEGGGLVGTGGEAQRPASLAAQAEGAQVDMTPERALQLALSLE